VTLSPSAAKNSAPLSILVVDDELLIRWSLSETLVAAGHAVVEAQDGASAIRALQQASRAPDVVLLDYRLPDSNDLRLLTEIRRIAPGAQVIMMTAFGTPEIENGALALGVYRVLPKPFEVPDMPALVQQAHGDRHPSFDGRST
jgi:DNA-binding NtrC family response regulator